VCKGRKKCPNSKILFGPFHWSIWSFLLFIGKKTPFLLKSLPFDDYYALLHKKRDMLQKTLETHMLGMMAGGVNGVYFMILYHFDYKT